MSSACATTAAAPKTTSSQTLSCSDGAIVITFLLLMEAKLCYYTENKPVGESTHRRSSRTDRYPLVPLLNLPALVVIVLAYIWAGLTAVAAIAAIEVSKRPTAIVTVRRGTRALDPALDEMATVFAIPGRRAFRHIMLPQLAPYIAAAARSALDAGEAGVF